MHELSEAPKVWNAQEAFVKQVGVYLQGNLPLTFLNTGWIQALHVYSICYIGIHYWNVGLDFFPRHFEDFRCHQKSSFEEVL